MSHYKYDGKCIKKKYIVITYYTLYSNFIEFNIIFCHFCYFILSL